MTAETGRTWLFVPGDRPERFARAAASGADHVIVDLEDSVTPEQKTTAREAAVEHVAAGARCRVRVNAAGTPWHGDDLAALAVAGPYGVVVPKAESRRTLAEVAAVHGSSLPRSCQRPTQRPRRESKRCEQRVWGARVGCGFPLGDVAADGVEVRGREDLQVIQASGMQLGDLFEGADDAIDGARTER